MENVLIIAVVTAVIGGILFYLYRSKKRGKRCMGCPYCKRCNGHCSDLSQR